MPDPTQPLPPASSQMGDDGKAFIRAQVIRKLREMQSPMANDAGYVEKAVEIYSQPNSALYGQAKAHEAKMAQFKRDEAASRSQIPGNGSALDVLERTGRDAAAGALRGITSPGRAVMHMTGFGDQAREAEQGIDALSGDSMGGRGMSANPLMGTMQEMVEPGAEMYANAKMIGNRLFQGAGVGFNKLAGAFPQSRILGALASAGKEGVKANVLPEMAKGLATTLAMPDETFAHGNPGQGLGYGAVMGSLGALSHGAAGPDLRGALGKINGFFEEAPPHALSEQVSPAATAAPEIEPIVAKEQPPVEPAQTRAQETIPAGTVDAAPPSAFTPAGGPFRKGFSGGDPLDWASIDPETTAKVTAAWEKAPGAADRAKLLGLDLGKDPDVVKNLTAAKTPQELFGYLQKGLVRSVGGKLPSRKGAKPVVVEKTGSAAPAGEDLKAKFDAATGKPADASPVGKVLEVAKEGPKVQDFGETVQGPGFTATEASGLPPTPAEAPKRPVKAKRQDVLANAPRTHDGMLDWDNPAFTKEMKQSLSRDLGKDYRDKVLTMKLADIQKMLKPAQFETFLKVLTKKPRAAAPVAEGSQVPEGTTSAPPEPIPTTERVLTPEKGAPGGKDLTVTPDEAPETPYASEVAKDFSPAEWDQMRAAAKIPHLERVLGDKGAASVMALKPWEELPPALRAKLQGDPQVARRMQLDRADRAKAPEGGAPAEGAGFRRKATGKRKRQQPGAEGKS